MTSPYTEGFAQNKDNIVWLHWDTEKGALVVSKDKNWYKEKEGSIKAFQAPPLSLSLLTIATALLAQDSNDGYST